VVVGVELIFPPNLTLQQQESIQTLLVDSGIQATRQQVLLDELHGAQLAKSIENPIGYLRALIDRAVNQTFMPERATAIANRREQDRALAKQFAAIDAKQEPASPEYLQEQLQRLPPQMRASLAKLQQR